MSPEESVARIDELVRKTESELDPSARAVAVELVQAVMELHRLALERVVEALVADSIEAIRSGVANDDLVSAVLSLHGIHPEPLETRVHKAIEKLRVYFDSRGAGIALAGIDSGVIRVRYTPARPGDGSTAKRLIEAALYEAAAEIEAVVIEGVDPQAGFVPLSALLENQPA